MKRVTAFVGSARKKNTYTSVKKFLEALQSSGEIETEIVCLYDYRLETCRGCKLCLDKGEELCPLKDDRDKLLAKIAESDGIVFASPNYAFQVSGMMKNFLDRIAFVFHRPRFLGKVYTSIVFQGIYGGEKIVKYLDFIGDNLFANPVKGICLKSFEPVPEENRRKIDRALERQSYAYGKNLRKPAYRAPSLLKLMIFRMSRTSIKAELNEEFRDYTYYREKGWFESDYYYDVSLGPLKKLIGRVFDFMAASSVKT